MKLLSIMQGLKGDSFDSLKRRVKKNFKRNDVRYKCGWKGRDIFFRVNQKTFFFIPPKVSGGVRGWLFWFLCVCRS